MPRPTLHPPCSPTAFPQERYERHHHVVYSSDALAAAVQLSSRYITDRFLPDKVRGGGVRCGGASSCRRVAHRCCAHWVSSNHTHQAQAGQGGSQALAAPSHHPLPPQAIDLLDEAGSRVRIASYTARKAAGGREGLEAANTSYLELEQVLATKAEAVQVRGVGLGRGGVGVGCSSWCTLLAHSWCRHRRGRGMCEG